MAASRKSGLGRGLDALLAVPPEAAAREGYAVVAIGVITPNPRQPRIRFDDDALEGLAASIARVGVLQPLVVSPSEADGAYRLVAGERRLRAAKLAGLSEVPVIIREGDDESSLSEALIENIQREDLDVLEEAAAFVSLLEDFGMTHDAVADRVGKSRSAVTNTIRLLKLPAALQSLLVSGDLAPGAARALLGLDDDAAAIRIGERAAAEGWPVRRVEDAVRAAREGSGDAKPATTTVEPKLRPAQIVALEERLADVLGTPVAITYGRGGGGRLTVRFGSVDDLERIYRAMIGSPPD
ncbi:MAG TPA: ParB/RepB/Spo0J family partition protein [Acidimicrobiia bacterium]|nr:ParB/RepB/Spo0J family partition protein [Acidimicrobiia bacterium]